MSKRINVNPGQYKVAGRERVGEDIVQTLQKQTFSETRHSAAGGNGEKFARIAESRLKSQKKK